MATLKTPRRHYLQKRIYARLFEFGDLEPFWQGKQEAEPGVALPESFPHRADLVSVGYSTIEDLDGADERELTNIGFNSSQATAILAALQALL